MPHFLHFYRGYFSGLFITTLQLIEYVQPCRNSQQDLFNAMGSMYASVIFMGVQNSGSVQPVVSVERSVFYRERAAHMYSPLPYALGQVTSSFLFTSFNSQFICNF